MNVVFVYADQPDRTNCSMWRMIWPAQALRRAGHTAHTVFLAQWLTRAPLYFQYGAQADWIVYERVLTDEVALDLQYWKAAGKRIAVDFDDAYHVMPSTVNTYQQWHQGTAELPVALLEVLRNHLYLADVVTVPTKTLADSWRDYGKTKVLKNYPDLTNENWNKAYPLKNRALLGWGGSQSHLHSFGDSNIIPAISDQPFLICGGSQAIKALFPHALCFDHVSPLTWPYHLGRIGIGLAPLAGAYDDHRSWNKVLEYSLKGIPWIATDAPPYQGCRGGLLIQNTTKAWSHAIDALQKDDQLYDRLSQEAKDWAWQQGIDDHINERITLYSTLVHQDA